MGGDNSDGLVSKAGFREAYFLHARPNDGWTLEYWDQFLEPEREPPMRYRVYPPDSAAHVRMMIVSDFAAREHRLFFMTEESEQSVFGDED